MAKRGRAGLDESQLRQLFDATVQAFESVGESAGPMFDSVVAATGLSAQTVKKYVSMMGLYADGSWQWNLLATTKPGDAFTLKEVEKKPVARPKKTDKPMRAPAERTIATVAAELEDVREELGRFDELKKREAELAAELKSLI